MFAFAVRRGEPRSPRPIPVGRRRAVRRDAVAALAVAIAVAAGGAQAQDAVDRGAYLARAADCAGCHTAPGGAPYAGGRKLRTPFGVLVGPNITQDAETGIGEWRRDDFDAALRKGMGRDGAPLYPAMPYLHYTGITDGDLDDLWAYFRTVKPVRHAVDVNRLPFPYDVRASLYGWRAAFFDEGRFRPDPARGPEFNRGAYLVEALGHCGSCHTPRDALGGAIADAALKGAVIEEWYAPDISNGPGSATAKRNVEELTAYLRDGHAADNQAMVGKMEEVVSRSLTHLTDEDRRAIAVYLTSRDGGDAPALPRAATMSADETAMGARIYSERCAACHGEDGAGAKGVGARLAGSATVRARKPYTVLAAILGGFPVDGVWGAMPSFADALDDREIAAVANHIRTSWGNDAPPDVDAATVAAWRRVVAQSQAGDHPGVFCPNVPAARYEGVFGDLEALGVGDLDSERIGALVADYRASHPGLDSGDAMLALYAGYCRVAAARIPDRSAMLAQVGAFNHLVSAAMAHAAP